MSPRNAMVICLLVIGCNRILGLPDRGELGDIDAMPPIDAPSADAQVALAPWLPTTPLAIGRYGHAAVAYNHRIYVVGGAASPIANDGTSDVLVAPILSDGQLGSWSSTTPFAIVRTQLTSVATNGYLYVLGGANRASEQIADVEYAPINADGTVGTWKITTPLPQPRMSSTTVVYGGRMYAIAGNYGKGGVNWQDVEVASINADGSLAGWTALTPLPSPRSDLTSVAFNGYLYAIGGGDTPGPKNDVLMAPFNADGTIGSWTSSTPLPKARAAHTTVVLGGSLFVMGGDGGASTPLGDVQVATLNPDGSVGTWGATTPLPSTREYFASVAVDERIYIIAGQRPNGPQFLDDVYVMTPGSP